MVAILWYLMSLVSLAIGAFFVYGIVIAGSEIGIGGVIEVVLVIAMLWVIGIGSIVCGVKRQWNELK